MKRARNAEKIAMVIEKKRNPRSWGRVRVRVRVSVRVRVRNKLALLVDRGYGQGHDCRPPICHLRIDTVILS